MHNIGTVPTFKMHNVGTVPTYKMYNIGTVPMFKMHNVGTLFFYDFFNLDFMAKINDRSLHPFFNLSRLSLFSRLLYPLFKQMGTESEKHQKPRNQVPQEGSESEKGFT